MFWLFFFTIVFSVLATVVGSQMYMECKYYRRFTIWPLLFAFISGILALVFCVVTGILTP